MDVPDPAETRTHAASGVEVSKWLDDSLFSFPAVAYQLASSREEPVTVRLEEPIPEEIAADELGFHPSYGSEHWHVDDEVLRFEYTLRPTGGFITVCGIRTSDQERIEELLTEPTEVSVIPPKQTQGDASATTADSGDDVMTGSAESAGAGGTQSVEQVPAPDGKATAAEADGMSAEGDAATDGTPGEDSGTLYRRAARNAQSATDDGSTAGTADPAVNEDDLHDFVRAVQRGDVSEAQIQVLREIFVSEILGSESMETRLRHLQNEVADLQAYSDALEEFIDEEGTAEQVLDRHREQVEAVETELTALRESVAATDETVASLATDLEDLEASHERLDDEVAELSVEFSEVRDDHEDVAATVADLDGRVPDDEEFADRFEELEREIVELRNWKENMRQIFS